MTIPKSPSFLLLASSAWANIELPRWAETALLDRASKRGKGQQPILVGALYRGSKQHMAMKAGGNDAVQIKVAKIGVATSSEKYVVAHSAHTHVRFVAVTWEELPPLESIDADEEESDNVNYRQSRRNWRAPTEPIESD